MSNASALLSTALLEKATKNNLEIGTMIRGNRSSHCRIEQNNDYNREIVISTVQNLNATRQSTHANKGAGHNGTPHTHTHFFLLHLLHSFLCTVVFTSCPESRCPHYIPTHSQPTSHNLTCTCPSTKPPSVNVLTALLTTTRSMWRKVKAQTGNRAWTKKVMAK